MQRVDQSREIIRKFFLLLAPALAGGTTFTSCDSRFKTAVFDGVEDFVLGLFDPTLYFSEDNSGSGSSFDF